MLSFLIIAKVEQKSQGLKSTKTAGPWRHIKKRMLKNTNMKKYR